MESQSHLTSSMAGMDGLRLPAATRTSKLHRCSSYAIGLRLEWQPQDYRYYHDQRSGRTMASHGLLISQATTLCTLVFAGTNAYFGSSASTFFYASSPPSTSAPTVSPVSDFSLKHNSHVRSRRNDHCLHRRHHRSRIARDEKTSIKRQNNKTQLPFFLFFKIFRKY